MRGFPRFQQEATGPLFRAAKELYFIGRLEAFDLVRFVKLWRGRCNRHLYFIWGG
jgi:hypothetical protein